MTGAPSSRGAPDRGACLSPPPKGVNPGRRLEGFGWPEFRWRRGELRSQFEGRTLLVGVDDMDVFKGIELKLQVRRGRGGVAWGVFFGGWWVCPARQVGAEDTRSRLSLARRRRMVPCTPRPLPLQHPLSTLTPDRPLPRIQAFERVLEEHPEFVGKAVLVQARGGLGFGIGG